jgi:subtilisin family serine protease
VRFIIDFINTADDADITAYLKAQKCTVVSVFDAIGKTYLVTADNEPATGPLVEHVMRDDEHGISLLEDEAAVVSFDPVPRDTHETTSEDNWWKLAVIADVDLDKETFLTTRTAHGIRAYVLDSGIDADHPEFTGRDVTLLHTIKDGDFTDTTGHGTALASIIVGNECGLTDASLKVVKIFHSGQTTYLSDLIASLNAVATDFLTDPLAPAVINCSWSIDSNDLLNKKFADMKALGLIVVAAAGNSSQPVANVSPAAIPEVFTIGSFGPSLTPSDFSNYTEHTDTSLTAGTTNYGPGLDLFAPGENIRVAVKDGTYGYTAGTSAAAAVASACFVSNIARIAPSYAYQTQEAFGLTIMYWATKDMLTLSGNFVDSPNSVVSVKLTPPEGSSKARTLVTAPRAVPVGSKINMRIADLAAYQSISVSGLPDGYSLEHNYIVGTAQASVPDSGFVVYEFPITLTYADGTSPDSYTLTHIVFDSVKFETDLDAIRGSGVTIRFSCINNCDCCSQGGFKDCDDCTCSGGTLPC